MGGGGGGGLKCFEEYFFCKGQMGACFGLKIQLQVISPINWNVLKIIEKKVQKNWIPDFVREKKKYFRFKMEKWYLWM